MDKTVIVLIGAGVCCVVIGLALFVKLLTTKQDESEDTNGNKNCLTMNTQKISKNALRIQEILKILLTSLQLSILEISICIILL